MLANNTWAQISEASIAGVASELWKLGDEKDGCAIIGFNHDDLADGSGKAGITFVCNDNNKTFLGIWASASGSIYVYENSIVDINLEAIYENAGGNNSTFSLLPLEIAKQIKLVKKEVIDKYSKKITIDRHLFLLSVIEFTGWSHQDKLGSRYEGYRYVDASDVWSRTKYSNSDAWYLAFRNEEAYAYSDNTTISKRYRYGFCI